MKTHTPTPTGSIPTELDPSSDGRELPFELYALSKAKRYQRWIYETTAPYLGRRILEVGAGVGNLSQWLPAGDKLVLSETDPYLLSQLRKSSAAGSEILSFDLIRDSVDSIAHHQFDTIISFNVLEHIENDQLAIQKMVDILSRSSIHKATKSIVCFVPAHQWAFGTFDRAFGHFRRYEASSLRSLLKNAVPNGKVITQYLNIPGLLGWWLQGRLLKRKSFGTESVQFFETLLPILRPIDWVLHKVFRLPIGQSLMAVVQWD